MATTNFLQFDIQQTNMLSDSNYSTDVERDGGFVTGISRSILFNKVLFQTSTMSTAIANVLKARGYDAMDNNLTSLQQAIDDAFSFNRGLPIGSIFPTTAPILEAPDGFLLPHGQEFDPREYPDLANVYRIEGDTYKYGQTYIDGIWYPKVPDLRGFFLRVHNPSDNAPDSNRSLGSQQGDAIRNMTGKFGQNEDVEVTGVFRKVTSIREAVGDGGWTHHGIEFDASLQVPTANENRPYNYAFTYLIVAKNEVNLGGSSSGSSLIPGDGIDITDNVISAKVMVGADGADAGELGAVPAPTATDNNKFLRGDGTWQEVQPVYNSSTNTLEF